MVEAIIFDWGGVCCSGADQFSAPVLLKHFELPASEINKKALDLEMEFTEGRISKKEFWGGIIGRLGVKRITTVDELRDHYFNSYTLFPEVLSLANKLKTNYKIALLSNLNEEMAPHIEKKHNIKDIFDPIIFSYRVGLRKPKKEIYELTLNKLGCQPEQTVFVDDSQKCVDSANSLGIKAVRFTDYENLKKDLKRIGVRY